LAGLSPLPEIQFRKYADPATEQINDLGWLRWRTAGKFEAPVVVRIPVGHSKKTGDPWHSVSAEAIYAHSLGWRIAMPSNAADAAGLLRSALRGHDPTLFLEHRALLDTPSARQPYPGDEFSLQFGQANRIQSGDALTIVSWGDMLHRCVEAAQDLEGIEIIDLRTIIPWDKEMIERSVKKTGKCLIAHEDAITAGFGAEISATLTETCFTFLDAPIMRVATKDVPIPYNTELMQEVIPTVEDLSKAMQRLLNW
jgi:2-oxoisovalerate dehydrogenase E1 component